ncbi:hypothetical protein [Legionella maceachernii]|uniref:Uncharacterized protein n=1 Tax=Legionella maceachernii TaxID=466 RepID=A0A0W0W0J5_9GAMM|nr:hypothetical protein [Legionella maceachernii]KTD25915.1 hypothetical protein Lmac_1686 [Legionella maceachernii]SJZ48387.1 hypothetical protein SAMN02745128_00193 [Legionella maceachernii]SUP03841.1 Uncharacterised protein [Legionella maceachernii]
MNRNKLIKTLVSQFEEQLSYLPDHKLEELESGKLEISLTQAVGNEAGGATSGAAKKPPTSAGAQPTPVPAVSTKARYV